MKLTEETQAKNLELFKKKLEEVAPENNLVEMYGEQLMKATFSVSGPDSLVGDGTLINTLLRKLTPTALKLNEMLPEELRVGKAQLIKVCLLHQISKCIKVIPNDNEWEIEKRGLFYKYDNDLPSIRVGLHSLTMAQESNIKFTLQEVEAMTINDNSPSDNMTRFYSSVFANLIKMANEFVYMAENAKQ